MEKFKSVLKGKGIASGAVFALCCLFFFVQETPARIASGNSLAIFSIGIIAWTFFLGFLSAGRFSGRKIFGILTLAFAALILVCFFIGLVMRADDFFDDLSIHAQPDYSVIAEYLSWFIASVALTAFACLAATADFIKKFFGERRAPVVLACLSAVSAALYIVIRLLYLNSLLQLLALAALAMLALTLFVSVKEAGTELQVSGKTKIAAIISLSVTGFFTLVTLIFLLAAAFGSERLAEVNSVTPLFLLFAFAACISLALLRGGKKAAPVKNADTFEGGGDTEEQFS